MAPDDSDENIIIQKKEAVGSKNPGKLPPLESDEEEDQKQREKQKSSEKVEKSILGVNHNRIESANVQLQSEAKEENKKIPEKDDTKETSDFDQKKSKKE